jgi:hypothetical protein
VIHHFKKEYILKLLGISTALVLTVTGAFAEIRATVNIKQLITRQDGRAYIQFENPTAIEGPLQCNDNLLYLGFNPLNASTLSVQTNSGMVAVALSAMTTGLSVRFDTESSGANCYTYSLTLQKN